MNNKSNGKSRILLLAVLQIIALLVVIPCAVAATSSNPYGMPSVARVLSTVHGKNSLDTAARQVGVFDQLISMLATLEGPRQFNRDQQSPEEVRLRMAYVSAENKIVASVEKELSRQKTSATGMNTPWAKWLQARDTYSMDKTYVAQTFFSATAQRRYAQAVQREKASEKAGRNALLSDNQSSDHPASAHVSGDTRFLFFMLVGVVIIFLYFTPIFIVGMRRGRYVKLVAILSLMFGFTGIGWLLGLILAFVGKGESPYGNQSISYNTSSSYSHTSTGTPAYNTVDTGQRARCPSCGGTGRQHCTYSACRSGYLYTGGNSFTELCPRCRGSGEEKCSLCSGSGYR